MKNIKINFYSGLLTLLPIVITLYIANWVFQICFKFLQSSFLTVVIRKIILATGLGKAQNLQIYTQILINLLSFIIMILFIIIIGSAMKVFLFKKIGKFFNNLFIKIPLFNQIYTTISQIIAMFEAGRQKNYQKVVAVEYPRKGMYAIGFITFDSNQLVEKITNEEMYNVFLPTSPNPTSGMLLVVKKSEIKILDMKVEDAIRLIISGGVLVPNDIEKK